MPAPAWVTKHLDTEPRPKAPENPVVTRCIQQEGAHGRASLEGCLKTVVTQAAPVSALDAGVSHRLGGSSRPATPCPSLLLPDIYFNGATGDDENSGVDISHPVLNPISVESRYSCGGPPNLTPWITANVTWHIAGPMPTGTDYEISPTIAENGSFAIVVDTTQTGSGTIASLTPMNRLGSQVLQADLGTGANAHLYEQIWNTTHPSHATVDALVSGNVMQITGPLDSTNHRVDTWANGDAFTFQTQNLHYLTKYAPTCGIQSAQVYFPSNCSGRATLTGGRQLATHPDGPDFWNANLSHVTVVDARFDGQGDFQSTTFFNSPITQSPHNFRDSIVYGGSISGLFVTGSDDPFGYYLDGDVILHGTTVFPPGSVGGNGNTWGDPGAHWFVNGGVYPGHIYALDPNPLTVSATHPTGGALVLSSEFGGQWNFAGGSGTSTAAQSFGTNIQLQTDLGTNAMAIDFSHSSSLLNFLPLSIAALDVPSPLGFNGVALNATGWGGFFNNSFSPPARSPYVNTPTGPAGGDLSGTYPNPTVSRIQTTPVSAAVPSTAQVLQLQTWTPGLLSCVQASSGTWLRGDLGVTTSSGNVTQWADQSGNGHNFTASGSNRPTTAAGIGGQATVHFNGTQAMQATNWVGTGAKTVLMIRKIATLPGGGSFGSFLTLNAGGTNISEYFFSALGGGYANFSFIADSPGSSTMVGTAQTLDTSVHVDVVNYNGSTVTNPSSYLDWLDGAPSTVINSGASGRTLSDLTSIGARLTVGSTASFGAAIDIADLVECAGTLSQSDLNTFCGYATARYGATCAGGTPSIAWTPTTVSGDATIASGGALSLATVATPGTTGDATHVAQVTIDAKGRTTSVSSVAITGLPVASLLGCGVNNQILQTVSGVQTCETVSGDVTLAAGVATLATTGVTAATYGDATHVAQITLDAKGRATSASSIAIAGSVTVAAGIGVTVTGGPAYTVGITSTGVTAATYGDATHVPQVTLNAQGQATAASSVAISFPGSFTCSNLSACTGAQLPASGLAFGGPDQALFTNNAGTAAVWGIFARDLAPTTTPGQITVVGFEGLPYTSTGSVIANGNVLTLTGAADHLNFQSPPASAALTGQGIGTGVSYSTGVVTNIAQTTIAVPASTGLVGWISFFIQPSGSVGADINVGIGIGGGCSTPAFLDSHAVSAVGNGSGGAGKTSASEVFDFGSVSGSTTICALVSSATTGGSATANIVGMVAR